MSEHQSIDDYIAARQAGDDARCAEIIAQASARFATRTTDGSELAGLLKANITHPLAAPNQ